MEKTTKKRKKSKRLKKRIGLVVVGGLSLVLTVCLSVGATLAWFAGSTWASNDLYMGGPVYVEMAGRGTAGKSNNTTTSDDGSSGAIWNGGAGTLDIVASGRSTGTNGTKDSTTNNLENNSILLPGQKLLIYSQARVFSTYDETTVDDNAYPSESSGADNSNVSDGKATYYNGNGRVQTTTTSVLRAKFSIDIEFDPSVGFNNFTDKEYAEGYPVQSSYYTGEWGTDITTVDRPEVKDGETVTTKAGLSWDKALDATHYTIERETTGTYPNQSTNVKTELGRRDAVTNTKVDVNGDTPATGATAEQTDDDVDYWVKGVSTAELTQIKDGISKCIYKWKYVSKEEYFKASNALLRMGEPFNGTKNTAGGPSNTDANGNANPSGSGNGYYGLFIGTVTGAQGSEVVTKEESDAFYKARTESYLASYVEHYVDDYNRNLVLQIGDSLGKLESSLNNSFVSLVNQSSDNIISGRTDGFTADEYGEINYANDNNSTATGSESTLTDGTPASWLYVDPTIGNDTNAGDSSSSVGGWWYLVSCDTGSVVNKTNQVNTVVDVVDTAGVTTLDSTVGSKTYGRVKYDFTKQVNNSKNDVTKGGAAAYNDNGIITNTFKRADVSKADGSELASNDTRILNAKLYEIVPNVTANNILMSTNPIDGTTTTKVVSISFPFVNGNFELPGKELTNVFANAKISFKITFQALQAFFPFANSIDGIPSGSALAGTGKALNIGNAIPIFNEAFDYLSHLDIDG